MAFWLDATGLLHVPQGNFNWAWVCWGVICQCQQEHTYIESGEFAWSCFITKLSVSDRKERML